jgi:hypothetical protein
MMIENDDDQKGMYLLIDLLQSKNEVESKYLSYESNCLKTMWLMAHVSLYFQDQFLTSVMNLSHVNMLMERNLHKRKFAQ